VPPPQAARTGRLGRGLRVSAGPHTPAEAGACYTPTRDGKGFGRELSRTDFRSAEGPRRARGAPIRITSTFFLEGLVGNLLASHRVLSTAMIPPRRPSAQAAAAREACRTLGARDNETRAVRDSREPSLFRKSRVIPRPVGGPPSRSAGDGTGTMALEPEKDWRIMETTENERVQAHGGRGSRPYGRCRGR
jgi:hypothetical protein